VFFRYIDAIPLKVYGFSGINLDKIGFQAVRYAVKIDFIHT